VDPVPRRPSITDFLVGVGEVEPYTEEELRDREKVRVRREDLANRRKKYEEDVANKERRDQEEAERIQIARYHKRHG
jgi:hypothetical protein